MNNSKGSFFEYEKIKKDFLLSGKKTNIEEEMEKILPSINYSVAEMIFQGISEIEKILIENKFKDEVRKIEGMSIEETPEIFELMAMHFGSIVLNSEYGESYRYELEEFFKKSLKKDKYDDLVNLMISSQLSILKNMLENSKKFGEEKVIKCKKYMLSIGENTSFEKILQKRIKEITG